MKPSKQKKKQEFKANAEGSTESTHFRIKLFGEYLKNEPEDEYTNNCHSHDQIIAVNAFSHIFGESPNTDASQLSRFDDEACCHRAVPKTATTITVSENKNKNKNNRVCFTKGLQCSV